jgi:hypothetical protein
MRHKAIRRLILFCAIGLIAALGWRWADDSPSKESISAQRASSATPRVSAAAEAPGVVATTPVARDASTGSRAVSSASGALSNAPTIEREAPIKIDFVTPPKVQQGERFTATVNLEALRGIRQLAFSVTYNKSLLQLVGSSAGTFERESAGPVQFGAEEPSEGNILVNLAMNEGLYLAGTGSVAVLEFQAIKAGTTPLAVQNLTFVETGSDRVSTTASVHPGSVTVE